VMGLLTPDLALGQLDTIDDVLAADVAYFTFLRTLLEEIAGLGLLLSAVGIYGVVANLAAERTKEVGVRMALGAQPAGLIWLFLKDGAQLAAIGAALGLVASFILMNVLGKLLPVVPGGDPRVVMGVACLLVVVALFACWLPAWRITRISPTIALRSE